MNNKNQKSRQEAARKKVSEYLANPANYPAVLEAIDICDGHTIFEPGDFRMLPEFVRDHFSDLQHSDPTGRNPKNNIYLEDNSVAPELYGIYGLDVIEAAARAHAVQSVKNGRGFRAKDLTEQLRAKLAQPAPGGPETCST